MNDGQYVNGCAFVLSNGDFIKTPSTQNGETSYGSALYYHNDKFYLTKANFDFAGNGAYNMYGMCGINANPYGTILDGSYRGDNASAQAHLGFIHGFISTCNNLDEAVTKSADLTMKLTYEITEVTA